MMSSSHISLPPELLDMIIQHLSGHNNALRSCALVSRTWSGFSQRALFRDAQVNLYTYKNMTNLLDDLISVPHLQTLVRGLAIYQPYSYDDIPLTAYMSCLASVLSLLPNLMKVVFQDEDISASNIVANRSYLDLIPNVLGKAPLVELDIDILYSVEIFHHVFGILAGTNVKRVRLSGLVDHHNVDFGATRKRLHLPSLEGIRFEVDGLQEEFHNCLTHSFDLPNLKQCEFVTEFADGLLRWHDVLLRGKFPPLELFKLELANCFTEDLQYAGIPEEDAYHPLPLAGLPFQHVHLSVNPGDLGETRKFIEWWSSTFRALSDSKATIHFTELTFSFTDLPDIDTLEEEWNSLDNSLAHTMFSTVRSIHFKGIDGQSELIGTEAAYTVLGDRIRLVLPRLASRGVLRLD
ncbi:hypothetical protein BDZ89DRAFT_1069497 [Hymenopellis radicata]|nr:hypothetical protein BDZ89DRAFT_1069497 [Hymenopellis radicata]